MSNIDVLMPAVSDLASGDWDFRFAALLTLQNQNVMGRGAVGFDLAEFDWGATERERARAKDFVLRATALAASGHRWSELAYHPPLPRFLRSEFAQSDSSSYSLISTDVGVML